MLTKGDAEFNGHGPKVVITVDLSRTAADVTANTCVEMTETVSDWTTGKACVARTVDALNTGLVTATHQTLSYTDTDHEDDDAIAEATVSMFDPALILSATCQGDHVGDDICAGPTCSHCAIKLGCVKVIAP